MDILSSHDQRLSKALIQWYSENKRDLPWRRTSNPYFIWISEVMLQQTQVETVIPYYERFITRFPTMYDLARAPEDHLLKEWEGLGYYSRARNLQAGVREVVEKYNASVPNDKNELLSVKGIGPYTAGAILSIAYQQPEPAVDGNVMRVASRLFLIEDDIAKAKTRRRFEEIVQKIIPAGFASEFNQALMELGALICKPKAPRCDTCPLSEWCLANEKGVQTELPVKKKKISTKKLSYTVIVLRDERDQFYIRKRPKNGLLAGLWEFPMVLLEGSTSHLEQASTYLDQHYGIQPLLKETHFELMHTFSHLKWELNVVYGALDETINRDRLDKGVQRDQLDQYPFSVPHQKIKNSLNIIMASN